MSRDPATIWRQAAVAATGLTASLLLAACVSVSYHGETRPPTLCPQVFPSKKMVPWPFKVMGYATASAPGRFTAADLEQAIYAKAKADGADGIVMHSISWQDHPVAWEEQDVVITPDFADDWEVLDDQWRGYGSDSFDHMVPVDRTIDEGYIHLKAILIQRTGPGPAKPVPPAAKHD